MVKSAAGALGAQTTDFYAPDRPMRWPFLRLDPRTIAPLLAVVNVATFTSTSRALVGFVAVFTLIFLLSVASARAIAKWCAVAAVFAFFWLALPLLWHSRAAILISYAAYWGVRFTVIAGWGIYAVLTLRVPDVAAAMTIVRAPKWLAVPSMVMIRFFPVAIAELRAINEAMVLRGLRPGLGGMVTHPLRTGELLMIPFLASSARIADELAAAALIKGVGRSRDRTTIVKLRWHVADFIVAIIMAGLLVWMVMTL